LGTILGGFNLGDMAGGTGDKGETASVDFSFGNVLRCMCFTREDPLEPKKQLSKINDSLEDVAKRLSKIETVSIRDGMTRRRSSMKSRKSLGGGILEQEEDKERPEEEVPELEEDTGSSIVEMLVPAVERNDDTNPYWIEVGAGQECFQALVAGRPAEAGQGGLPLRRGDQLLEGADQVRLGLS
jgi:hypothetical protein